MKNRKQGIEKAIKILNEISEEDEDITGLILMVSRENTYKEVIDGTGESILNILGNLIIEIASEARDATILTTLKTIEYIVVEGIGVENKDDKKMLEADEKSENK